MKLRSRTVQYLVFVSVMGISLKASAVTVSGASGALALNDGDDLTVTSSGSITGAVLQPNFFTANHRSAVYSADYNDTNTSYGAFLNQGTITLGAGGSGSWPSAVTFASSDTGPYSNTLSSFTNTGTIEGSTNGRAVVIQGFNLSGNFINSGTMSHNFGFPLVLFNISEVGGNIVNSGTMTHSGAENAITVSSCNVSGNIQNSGTITSAGARIIRLIKTNTVAMSLNNVENTGTLSNAGAGVGIQIANSNATAALTIGSIVNGTGGSITVNNDDGIVFSNATGTLTVTTLRNDGTITANNDAIDITAVHAITNVINTGTLSGDVGIRVVTLSGAGITNFTNSGTITGTTRALDFSNGAAAFTLSNSGTLNGECSLGINSLVFTGNNSRAIGRLLGDTANTSVQFSGSFTTEGVIEDIPTVTVNSGGTLNLEHNILNTTTLANNGTVAVTATNSRSVGGAYTQGANAILSVGANSAATGGTLAVSGTANLTAGATVKMTVPNTRAFSAGQTISNVLTSGGLTASTLNGASNVLGLTFTPVVNGNNIDVNVSSGTTLTESLQSTGSTNTGASAAIDQLYTNGVSNADLSNVLSEIAGLSDDQAKSDAIDTLVPSLNSNQNTVVQFNAQSTGAALQSRRALAQVQQNLTPQWSRFSRFVNQPVYLTTVRFKKFGLVRTPLYRTQAVGHNPYLLDVLKGQHFWINTSLHQGNQKKLKGYDGYESHYYRVSAGYDTRIKENQWLGLAATYTNGSMNSKPGAPNSKIDTDFYQLILYGEQTIEERYGTPDYGTLMIQYQGDFGLLQGKGSRSIVVGNINRVASSKPRGTIGHLEVGCAYNKKIDASTEIAPRVRLDYSLQHMHAYTETGASSLNLSIDKRVTNKLFVSVGLQRSNKMRTNDKLLLNIDAQYDILNKRPKTLSNFLGGGDTFITNGLKPGRVSLLLGTQWQHMTQKRHTFNLSADIEARDKYLSMAISAKLKLGQKKAL